jgi:hypothetical protein
MFPRAMLVRTGPNSADARSLAASMPYNAGVQLFTIFQGATSDVT